LKAFATTADRKEHVSDGVTHTPRRRLRRLAK
jgi:hypothetical protein